jgi:hypothetical protein
MLLTDRDRACAGPRDAKPRGSVAWCWQTLDLLKIRWHRKDFTDQQFEETLAELRQHEVWNVVPPEQPYGSLDTMLEAEIGCREQDAKERLLYDHGGDRRSKEFQDYNCNLEKALQGNTARYILNRLKRKRPDLAEAYARGEYRSVHAAAKVAGWVKAPTPLDELHRAWRKASDDERQQFFYQIPDSEREVLVQVLVRIEAPRE